MANKFIGHPSVTGEISFIVKDTKGNVKKEYKNKNDAIQAKILGAQILLGLGSLGISAVSDMGEYGLYNAKSEFTTAQEVTKTDGGCAGLPGMAVYDNFARTGGTYLGAVGIGFTQSSYSQFNPNMVGTGSFLSDGTCSAFNMGAQWHNSNYGIPGSKSRGFACEYFMHGLGGGAFQFSSGDTITVSWGVTLS